MLQPAIETEISALAARYGMPQRIIAPIERWPFTSLGISDRYGEVCMVIRRTNGRLLTATKTFYPPHAHRLLTGGVHHGELIEAALWREVFEETGLDVAIVRFLAVIEYKLEHQTCEFSTFAFLLDELGGTLGPRDAGEQLAEYRELEIAALPEMAETLSQSLPPTSHDELAGDWRDWGRFRAIAHRVIYEALQAAP